MCTCRGKVLSISSLYVLVGKTMSLSKKRVVVTSQYYTMQVPYEYNEEQRSQQGTMRDLTSSSDVPVLNQLNSIVFRQLSI